MDPCQRLRGWPAPEAHHLIVGGVAGLQQVTLRKQPWLARG